MPTPALRLVIVEDDANLAAVVAMGARESLAHERELLVETHATAEAAEAAIERLAAARETRVVVLSDHHLPPSERTGLDVLAKVRERLPHAKRLLMTGRDRRELEPALTQAQLDGFLAKPFPFPELRQLLQRAAAELPPAKRVQVEPGAEASVQRRVE